MPCNPHRYISLGYTMSLALTTWDLLFDQLSVQLSRSYEFRLSRAAWSGHKAVDADEREGGQASPGRRST